MILSNYGVVVQAFYICHLQPIKLSKYIKSVEIVAIQVLGFIEDEWTFNIASFKHIAIKSPKHALGHVHQIL